LLSPPPRGQEGLPEFPMYPDLFSIGPLTLHTYGLFVAIGFASALLVAVKIAKDSGIRAPQVIDMGFIMILSAVIGSRIMYILFNLSFYVKQPLDIFKVWEGGLVFSGGIIAAVAAISWHIRRHHLPFWATADLWAPAVALGQGIGRIGCLMAGCCYGKPTDLPWGIVFSHPRSLAPLHIALHPTQLYAALSGCIIFLILIILQSRKQFEGQVILWFLILHSTGRLLIERFRGDFRGIVPGMDMSVTQLVTLIILAASVATLFLIKVRNKKNKSQS